ncbi:MAG: hypothetical protein COU11_03210 [Candidatus Harrisonbacteria bacterium CG10_big_fil_rev_8_21_14_0_10_49_15]|uniref:Uncharacterized protein n=1 Tax=Candidatus Harrisonbacteria bacterium CG10_big_fil_rev_8_21_14_0_10_49_15 TaxID=1974587 RepID=A0A2H0UKC8_9BACT|nr:MAG: hypothetical protein COU11_03210 [Candidatus Harrisonbacteria bacterium CG10_big_fil_rev_8_21_14_0_10_49_15]
MYNWSTDTTELKKDPEKYAIWRLEQLINFGLNGEKISERELRRYWDKLEIDEARRQTLEILLREKS